ncbi:MAG: NADH-quinone oxidoreductase subunit M, partial [Planctomycetes bacterium]|nr:NADH-quinone oxidoreductase subunit M [Planctomycetota bacterium]
MDHLPILSLLTFIPLVGGVIILFMNKDNVKGIRWMAALASFIPLALSFEMLRRFDSQKTAMQFVEGPFAWIPAFKVHYYMGADGLSVPLLFLTALLSFLSVIASFNIEKRVKEYFFFFLLLEVGMTGVFCALDFFLFYVFWEVMLVPMYFLIGIWGGPRKEYAAIKFFLYTLFGSVIMLLAMLAFYFNTGT